MMPILHTFGCPAVGVTYTARPAAYAVMVANRAIAAVRVGPSYFLPGGGALAGETAEETVLREIREELGCGARLLQPLGTVRQYFYAAADDQHYIMDAVFFAAELVGPPAGTSEHVLHWVPLPVDPVRWYHPCHAWAVRRHSGSVMGAARD